MAKRTMDFSDAIPERPATVITPEPMQAAVVTVPALPDPLLTMRKTELTEPLVNLNLRVRDSLRRKLRQRSLDTGLPVQDIVGRLIEEYLARDRAQ